MLLTVDIMDLEDKITCVTEHALKPLSVKELFLEVLKVLS